MSLQIGSSVVVRTPKEQRWDGEPGRVLAAHPPGSESPHSFDVLVAGRVVILRPDELEVEQ